MSISKRALSAFALSVVATLSGCVTVRPQQRTVLSDPIMQFEGDRQAAEQVRHALDNREGSYGGAGVSGGGCGCN